MTHACPECGMNHDEPVVVTAPEPEAAVEATVEADVEIARIEGDTAVKIAKIEAGVAEDAMETRLAEMEGQIRGMREVLDRIAPEPEPTPDPVVIDAPPVPEPDPVMEMPPRDEKTSEPRSAPKKRGFFG